MARQERSAGFIIFRNGTDAAGTPTPLFLLLDYGRHWDFAKGHVERGEDDLAAALRELREETGLTDPKVIPGFHHEIAYFFRDRKKGLIRKTVTFFLAEVFTPEVVLSHEHSGYDFLPFEEAIKRVTFPTARQVLRVAYQSLSLSSVVATETPDEVTDDGLK